MLRLKKPLNLVLLHIEQNSSNELFAYEPELEMNLSGETEEKLIQAANDELIFLWETYGKAPDHILTTSAQELKRKILEFLEEC